MNHKRLLSLGTALFLTLNATSISYACTNPKPFDSYTRVDQAYIYDAQNDETVPINRYVHRKNITRYNMQYNDSYVGEEIDPDDMIDNFLTNESFSLFGMSNSGYDSFVQMLQKHQDAMNGSRNFAKEFHEELKRNYFSSTFDSIPYDALLQKQAEYYKDIGIQQTFSPTLEEIKSVPYQWEYVENNYKFVGFDYRDEISNWRLKNEIDGTYVANTWFQSPLTNGWYYFNSDGYMVCGHTSDGYFTYLDGLWMGSEPTR